MAGKTKSTRITVCLSCIVSLVFGLEVETTVAGGFGRRLVLLGDIILTEIGERNPWL